MMGRRLQDDGGQRIVRRRLVAREFTDGVRYVTFAGTPPLKNGETRADTREHGSLSPNPSADSSVSDGSLARKNRQRAIRPPFA